MHHLTEDTMTIFKGTWTEGQGKILHLEMADLGRKVYHLKQIRINTKD